MTEKEKFINEVQTLLDANKDLKDVTLDQIVDMVHELSESYRY